ncbi:hypothetical protein [Pantoea sp. LMR881]|uniref:hypothetical protein n=1 Tax=Pantoea sp. LMR881 TaxID=3014336 RepID=UPI0022AFDCB9|nr:hypothetical protein [Pantoea sp. LMR881]
MLFNHSLKKRVESIPADIEIVSHDWFLYILCSGLGGVIIYDPQPGLLYRQHQNNLVGSNNHFFSKVYRLKKLFSGEFRRWTKINDRWIKFFIEDFTLENQKICKTFSGCSSPNAFFRVKSFIYAKVYRQYKLETFIFMIMSALNKLK